MKYTAPRWLPSGHLQTIYPATCIAKPAVAFRRERWDTPDGDFVDVDFVDGQPGLPMVVLFHGLEGSSDSHYSRALMAALARRGWSGVIPHFRGCSGEMNLAPRFYHSGDAQEIDWVARRLRARHTGPLFAAGVSLGGNALLRWLGESQHQAEIIDAAVAVSAPLDLAAGGKALSSGFNLIYTRVFLQTLKPKCLRKPMLSCPPETASGIEAARLRMRVSGPGQKAAISLAASGGSGSAHRAGSAPAARCTMTGWSAGRPLAA
jgi:hypothetical protein